MTNHNKLLSWQEGCLGLKTGYTRAAGRTLVSCAEKNGQRLIAVTLQDGNDWADHQSLYDYGFSHYPASRGAATGEVIGQAAVTGGMQERAALVAAERFSWPLAEDETLEMRMETVPVPTAPVIAGTPAGEAVFFVNGREVGRVDLLWGETVMPEVRSAMAVLKPDRR